MLIFRKHIFFVFVLFFLTMPAVAFAGVAGQKDGLFWIDVPMGWQWLDESGGVIISSPSGNQAINIEFENIAGVASDEDLVQFVRDAMDAKIQELASLNCKLVLKTERRVDGIFAIQSGFLISSQDGIRQATSIIFFKDNRLFSIYFHALREFQRMEMESIVDTLKFEAPEKEEVSEPVLSREPHIGY